MKVLILGSNYGLLVAAYLRERNIYFDIFTTSEEAQILETNGFTFFYKNEVCAVVRPDNCWSVFFHLNFINIEKYDLVILAMQEPTFSISTLESLVKKFSNVPILSVMNIPPSSFIRNDLGLHEVDFSGVYHSSFFLDDSLTNKLIHTSAEPQIFSSGEEGCFHIRLKGAFRCSFGNQKIEPRMAQLLLRPMVRSKLPVTIKNYLSPWISVSKFPMLIAGNYRCISNGALRSISDAVQQDLKLSEAIYLEVANGLRALGAPRSCIVPFKNYSLASTDLTSPSSVARALISGRKIERTDKLLQHIFHAYQLPCVEIDKIVGQIDEICNVLLTGR
jgi:hypothetical protein